jgi:N-acetylglutamate synthase-like GNAT family acetyltransferase
MDCEVRAATERDADALAAVYRSAYAQNRELGFPAKAEHSTAEQVAEWIRDYRVLVATVDGDVVGGVRLEATDDSRGKLSRLGVHEDWKSEGIGSLLVARAERAARDAGWEELWLTTPGEHPFLPGFYRSRGYERTGDYPLEYRDYDEIVMEKSLG